MSHCGTPQGWLAHKAANTPACRFCKSAKAKEEAGTLVVASPKTKQAVAKCGTVSGQRVHRRNGEPVCRACREAHNAYQRGQYVPKPKKAKGKVERVNRDTAPHGTMAAYQRHLRDGEQACDPCRAAAREKSRLNREKAGVKPHQPAEHGTIAAYNRHYRAGETPCPPCRQASNDDARERRAKKKAEGTR